MQIWTFLKTYICYDLLAAEFIKIRDTHNWGHFQCSCSAQNWPMMDWQMGVAFTFWQMDTDLILYLCAQWWTLMHVFLTFCEENCAIVHTARTNVLWRLYDTITVFKGNYHRRQLRHCTVFEIHCDNVWTFKALLINIHRIMNKWKVHSATTNVLCRAGLYDAITVFKGN